MTEILIDVCGADAKKTGQEGILTTGMTGAVVTFRFDASWDKLTKTAVLRGGGVTKDVLNADSSVTIPAEVLSQEGLLDIGVEGRSSDGSIVIPTVWVHGIFIHAGANTSGDVSTAPALPVWAQLQTMIGDLSKLDTDAKESLVAAVNEVLSKGGSDVTAEDIAKAVNAWLAKNPITVTETDPTVPAWAKQAQKPAYTAQEVGALPADTVIPAVPAALPNPHALTFTGAASGSYDGSEAVNIDIPEGGGASGGKEMRLLRTFAVAEGESVTSITVDACDDGTPFSQAGYRKIGVKLTTKGTSDVTDYQDLYVRINGVHVGYGYGNLKKSLYSTARKCYFTVETQGTAIVLTYASSIAHHTGGTAQNLTGDVINPPANLVSDVINSVTIYHNTLAMEHGTVIEVWGVC